MNNNMKHKQEVLEWAKEKGLTVNVTPEMIEKQSLKVLEEIGETAGAYLKGDREGLIDGIGDVVVTMLILAEMKGHLLELTDINPERCKHILFDVSELLSYYVDDNYDQWLCGAYTLLSKFAKSQELNIEDCLESAYNVIKNRTGKLQNGTFIKD